MSPVLLAALASLTVDAPRPRPLAPARWNEAYRAWFFSTGITLPEDIIAGRTLDAATAQLVHDTAVDGYTLDRPVRAIDARRDITTEGIAWSRRLLFQDGTATGWLPWPEAAGLFSAPEVDALPAPEVDVVRAPADIEDTVGTSGVDLDFDVVVQAVDMRGPHGRLVLHPEQIEQLGPVETRGGARIVADASVPIVNGGRDWLGRYEGPRGIVGIISRRTAPVEGR